MRRSDSEPRTAVIAKEQRENAETMIRSSGLLEQLDAEGFAGLRRLS